MEVVDVPAAPRSVPSDPGPTGEVADVLGPDIALLLCGINPGQHSGARGRHFAGPSNRFWPALHAAGLTPERFGPDDQDRLPGLGIGITNLVPRTTSRASELTREELRAGAARLLALVDAHRPRVIAVLGITAFRVAFARPRATIGEQADVAGPTRWWLLSNPSGLNAHAHPDDHARGLADAGRAAGRLP